MTELRLICPNISMEDIHKLADAILDVKFDNEDNFYFHICCLLEQVFGYPHYRHNN